MTGIGGVDARGALAQEVADATLAVPGVSALSGGVFGAVATYLPGGRVEGVSFDDGRVHVQIVAGVATDLRVTADRVRAAVQEIVGEPVDVTVADLDVGDDEEGRRS